MAIEDKIKWNKKYKETPKLLQDRDACIKLKKFYKETSGKKALEIACGAGRNSIFLAQNNFEVDACDISDVALNHLKSLGFKNINTILTDFDEFATSKKYDLIIMTNFLDRNLIKNLPNFLNKDGIIIIETYMEDKENEKKPSNANYLLKIKELKTFFDNSFEILDYDEFFNESYELFKMKKQSIVVKKIF